MKVLYDPKCEELARWFLDDADPPGNDAEVQELAGAIQLAIEDWSTARQDELARQARAEDQGEDYSGQGEE